MIKEFCISVGEGERLNLTFTPSSTISNTYAFINGIEIVSMPTNLYYNNPTYKFQTHLLGIRDAPYAVENDTALELMYRINVGGSGISPHEDTGMYREWEVDYIYLPGGFPIARSVDRGEIDLKFSIVKNYTAPELIYRTAQSMGPNATSNEHEILTYTFLVDTGFTYLVMLHFCELVFTNASQRVFEIYVASFLAERSADVVNWSEESRKGIPLYRDYAITIGNITGVDETVKQNLNISLLPAELTMTVYADVILNGIEIFKISNEGDLSGTDIHLPTTKPSSVSPTNAPPSANNPSKYAIIGGVLSGVMVLSFVAFLIILRRSKLNKGKDAAASCNRWTSWFPFNSFTTTNKSTKSRTSTIPSALCRFFLLSEIKAVTNNFDEVFIIGCGGFGDVYKGFISSLLTEVAIKRLKQGSQQGATEFKTEIEMLSQLRHLHLVSLIGYCDEDNEMILVYDYMSRGTLRDHLYNTNNPPLSWARRLEICIGAARGLQYLHSGVKRMIIHRDVKTTNILLDEKWVAKVSDFGLSKIGPNSSSITHVSTMVKGSVGYLDPEYYYLQHLTEKSDVYSFGVVLCEVLCARPPINRSMVDKPVSLVILFRNSYQAGSLSEIIDPCLIGNIAPECLNKYAEVAFGCILESGVDRPSMSDVVRGLEFALELQESSKEQFMQMKASDGDNGQEEEEIRPTEVEFVAMEIPLKAKLIYG